MVNKLLISKMKKGPCFVNTARGALTGPEDVAKAVSSGHIAYGGDVWPEESAPKDMSWRFMHNPYGKAHVKDILGEYFDKRYNYPCKDLICINGEFVTKSYGQHKK
ncbi:Formate dehydrogenase [Candida viswanathii]|uniref:Formate dehydrogenase n=1 Tax=Candida viswanathii TaxID=5486 RepID=A0A367XY63_9ASCO|nr:Formate dehydrogenase [Candida viswanathii]